MYSVFTMDVHDDNEPTIVDPTAFALEAMQQFNKSLIDKVTESRLISRALKQKHRDEVFEKTNTIESYNIFKKAIAIEHLLIYAALDCIGVEIFSHRPNINKLKNDVNKIKDFLCSA